MVVDWMAPLQDSVGMSERTLFALCMPLNVKKMPNVTDTGWYRNPGT